MADETERWDRIQQDRSDRSPFQAKASPVSLYASPERRRNLDKEEAERDRLVFRWVMFGLFFVGLIGALFLVASQLGVDN